MGGGGKLFNQWLFPLFSQLLRYAAIGILAAFTYFLSSVIGVELFSANPQMANIIAAIVTAMVSYIGHHYFTFRCAGNHKSYLPKFIVQLTIVYVVSQIVVHIGVVFHWNYLIAVAINIVLLPVIGFIFLKIFVFVDALV